MTLAQLGLQDVQRWLDAYIAAWRSYDPDDIADLFSPDVRYEPEPYTLLEGRDAVVAAWREEPDASGSWDASYEPVAIDGWLGVATGTSRYRAPAALYHNVFLLTFGPDGRCRHYREWYMRQE